MIVNNIDNKRAWRLSVFLQGICEVAPCILIMCFKNEDIDILAKEKNTSTEKKYLDDNNLNNNEKVEFFKKYNSLGKQS